MGITGAPWRTLRTTNHIENLNDSIAHYTRNVKRWRDGQMTLRWIAPQRGQERLPRSALPARYEEPIGALDERIAQDQTIGLKAA